MYCLCMRWDEVAGGCYDSVMVLRLPLSLCQPVFSYNEQSHVRESGSILYTATFSTADSTMG